jgi:hypothetical protein
VTATSLGLNSIRVDWQYTPSAVRDESGYLIERSPNGVNGWQVVGTRTPLDLAAAAGRTFTDTGLDPGATYHYRVSTFNPAGAKVGGTASATTQSVATGTLAGTVAASTGDTNLTTEGNLDWVHWGHNGDPEAINAKFDGAFASDAFNQNGNFIAFEAEDHAAITDPQNDGDVWTIIDDVDNGDGLPLASTPTTPASGAKALYAKAPSSSVNGNDESFATYNLNFSAAGTYRFYTRIRAIDEGAAGTGDNDSMFTPANNAAVNAAPDNTYSPTESLNWAWQNDRSFVATAGTQTFTMVIREGGWVVDRIVFGPAGLTAAQLDALVNSAYGAPVRGTGGPITDFTVVGSASPTAVSTPAKTFSWTGGAPTTSATATDDAVAVSGAGNGFRFDAPITTFERKLRVYVGANNTKGVLKARFRYGNTRVQETTIGELDATGQGQKTGVFEITYSNSTPGGVLEVEYTAANDGGDVSLHAATYVEFIPPAPLTDLTANGTGKGRIAISWTDNAINETGYVVQRAPDVGGQPGTFATIATAAPNARSYVDTGLADNTKFHYRVVAVNAVNANSPVPGNTPVISATTVPLPGNAISGVRGQYYDYGGPEPAGTAAGDPPAIEQVNFSGYMSARVDDGTAADGGTHRGPIDFAWTDNAAAGTGYPALPNLTSQNFWSARWDGSLIADFTGLHTFFTDSDDGGRFYIDINQNGTFEANERVINNWVDQGQNAADLDGSNETAFGHPDWLAGIPLVAGQRYRIRAEMYERGGSAGMRLFWSNPFSQTPTIVQTSSLFTDPPETTPPRVTAINVDARLPAAMAYTPDAHIAVVFSEDIANTLDLADMFLTDGISFYGSAELAVHGYDAATNTVVIRFPGLPNRELANGNWQLLILDGTVSDAWGNLLDGDNDPNTAGGAFTGNFYFSQADTQLDFYGNPKRDRIVDFVDYQRLAANFGKPNPSHADGDFNHDGVVDNADFIILRNRFGQTLPPPPSPASPVGSTTPKAPASKTPAARTAAAVAPIAPVPIAKPKAPAKFAVRKITDVLA